MLEKPRDYDREERRRREEGAILTDRDFFAYVNRLGLNPEEMIGKLVLDIGSGKTELFRQQAEEKGIKVVSLNPKKKIKERVYRNDENEGEPLRSVMADAQELPFSDETFDYEVALFSVPMYLADNINEKKDCESFIEEIVRTLKPKGKAYIYPILREVNSQKPYLVEALEGFRGKVTYEFNGEEDEDERLIITKIK